MHRNQSVNLHQFAMIPRADIPRSKFLMQKSHKTVFDAGDLVPIFCEEVLPGDMFSTKMTAFARLSTPIFPTLDNMHMECFWFFCPNRLVWDNWQKFMGEQVNPGDSISFTIPICVSPTAGYVIGTLHDYFGLPTLGQVSGGAAVSHSNLPLRMYNLIWNEWFRDQNLQNSAVVDRDDGPDDVSDYFLRKRGKRHDYFTSALPFVQKGTAASIPLGGTIPILPSGQPTFSAISPGTGGPGATFTVGGGLNPAIQLSGTYSAGAGLAFSSSGLVGDLSSATAVTINQLRQAFQIQKVLERDARGGTRYTEIIRAHFGVISPDARLQRPEYLGGGHINITINPVAQTSGTSVSGSDTPQGNLSAIGTGLMQSSFTQSFTEHGYVMCLVNVRNDLTYQQGLRRHWSRSTRYDFYLPAFAMLGEQAILRKEIYSTGVGASDEVVFGYQERWAEYRYLQNEITGIFRSTAAQTIDPWHYAEFFQTAPGLNSTFIEDPSEDTTNRSIAVPTSEPSGYQFLFDAFFEISAARPMPLYSVPGLIDHF